MSRAIYYIAVLIGIFLVVVYYKGTTSVIGSTGSAIGNLIAFLQGRSPGQANVSNYPQ